MLTRLPHTICQRLKAGGTALPWTGRRARQALEEPVGPAQEEQPEQAERIFGGEDSTRQLELAVIILHVS